MNRTLSSGTPHVGFVSTRLAGTDGVSLEAEKWATFMEKHGCECYFMAGEMDTPSDRSVCIEEAHFKHSDIREIQRACFGAQTRPCDITRKIEKIKDKLKAALGDFIEKFDIDLLVAENVLSLPMNIPLGLAITEAISETGIPTIGHHHDFYWERPRLLANAVWDYINMAFPPRMPSVHHVVINSSARHQLSLRTGMSATLMPNVLDFENPPGPLDNYAKDVREAFGFDEDGLFILQPTRVVARKGIEHAVELVHRLGMKAKLVISHAAGDEELEYKKRVRSYSDMLGVNTIFAAGRMSDERGRDFEGRKIYALRDVYPHADLVTYPSTIEGFGNAFLEAIYFKTPIVVNMYSIFMIDIKPKGFRTIEFEHYVTDETVERCKEVLSDDALRRDMVEHNFELGRRYYSYSVMEQKLENLLTECLGQ